MIQQPESYSYFHALRVYVMTSLRAISRNPSSIVFGFIFPVIFIVIFGFIGNRTMDLSIGVIQNGNQENPMIEWLSHIEQIKLIRDVDEAGLTEKLRKGEVDALLRVEKADSGFVAHIQTSDASPNGMVVLNMMRGLTAQANLIMLQVQHTPLTIAHTTIEGRRYKTIDFILPGQLGFVVLSSGIFGAAYLLIALKSRLVIKRMFATPAPKSVILVGEAIARMLFALAQVSIIVLIGKWVFGFTLINGWVTLLMMLLVCLIALMVFLGFGMIVSNIARHEQAVPPIANLIVMPQFLLAGTFFSIRIFPDWLQPVCHALPLTYVNNALRKIAFEGAGFADVSFELLVLGVWGVIVYAVAVKLFKWE